MTNLARAFSFLTTAFVVPYAEQNKAESSAIAINSLRAINALGDLDSKQIKESIIESFEHNSKLSVNVNHRLFIDPNCDQLFDFFAEQQVKVVASFAGIESRTVDKKLGVGVFEATIKALLDLNDLGYGFIGRDLNLDIVFEEEVCTSFLKGAKRLEFYRSALLERYGIVFNDGSIARNLT